MDLKKVTIDAAFHCVTQWSRLQNTWEGVRFNEVLAQIEINRNARYVMIHCYGGYSTNLPIEVLTDNNVLFAFSHNGTPLTKEHGGPLRLIVPNRYGWKSAKWVNGLEFMSTDRPGFWELRGYNMRGDPWNEERFWSELS